MPAVTPDQDKIAAHQANVRRFPLPVREVIPCKNLGDPTGRELPCVTCQRQGKPKTVVEYGCSVHKTCTVEKRAYLSAETKEVAKCCQMTCGDYAPAREPTAEDREEVKRRSREAAARHAQRTAAKSGASLPQAEHLIATLAETNRLLNLILDEQKEQTKILHDRL